MALECCDRSQETLIPFLGAALLLPNQSRLSTNSPPPPRVPTRVWDRIVTYIQATFSPTTLRVDQPPPFRGVIATRTIQHEVDVDEIVVENDLWNPQPKDLTTAGPSYSTRPIQPSSTLKSRPRSAFARLNGQLSEPEAYGRSFDWHSVLGALLFAITWGIGHPRVNYWTADSWVLAIYWTGCVVAVAPFGANAVVTLSTKHKDHLREYSSLSVVFAPVMTLLALILSESRDPHTPPLDDAYWLLGVMYASPAFALYLGQRRLIAAAGMIANAVLMLSLGDNGHVLWYTLSMGLALRLNYLEQVHEQQMLLLRQASQQQESAMLAAQSRTSQAADQQTRSLRFLSHEIRNPLNGLRIGMEHILGMKALEKEGESSAGLFQCLDRIEDVLHRVVKFDGLLLGHMESSSKPYDLRELMERVTRAFMFHSGGLEIRLAFDDRIDAVTRNTLANVDTLTGGCIVFGDEYNLEEIVAVIVKNALGFNSSGGATVIRVALIAPPDLASTSDAQTTSSMPTSVMEYYSSCDRDHIGIRIDVEDSGVGISKDDMANHRIFEPYVETERGLQMGGKRNGLGLALAREMIDHIGGRFRVQSTKGRQGSTFTVELLLGISNVLLHHPAETMSSPRSDTLSSLSLESPPSVHFQPDSPFLLHEELYPTSLSASPQLGLLLSCGGESTPSSASMSSPASPPQLDFLAEPKLRVLVVDDDACIRMFMERLLTKCGCSVQIAEDGELALQRILEGVDLTSAQASHPFFDLVFLDNQMPKKTGLEVIRTLRKLRSADFVVGVTANILQVDQDEFFEAGLDAVLSKPVRKAQIQAFLEEAKRRRGYHV